MHVATIKHFREMHDRREMHDQRGWLRVLVLGCRRAPAADDAQLTERERQVLDLVAAGRSNAQIAQTLFLSPKTVRNLVSTIFAKIHVEDRAQAIVTAREAGLGRPS
jgi:DNA-binding NarL/FixJ family response regulator